MNPFTYQFFLSAIHSYNDKMLMYFIDEAVGIYCNLTGKAVGPRPASPKDYNAEYADAYEVANYAVFIVARKMGSYNPQEEFRPYLRKALENAIKDILKEDGEGDFFNKTAHRKKKRDEEPEQHQKVNIDSFNSPDRESPEPDSEASERAGRIMKHSNDALEAMIKFVDSLPEMKRAALYASAFGQALRPDLENYGRNYADILAGIYNTTAIYIRKLAAQGKKAALAEVRRQGFSESSMAEVSMGFIQAKTPPRDIHDEVIRAIEKLSPYQQFMFLRHLSSIKENDNSITTMTFKYTQQNATLTPSQEALLGQIENSSFPFEGIKQLKELRRRTGVTVVVADNAHLVKVLQDSIKTINEQFTKFFEESRKDAKYGRRIHNETEEILYRRRTWAEKQLNPNGFTLLGLYSRKLLWFDDAKPTVFLFADSIRDYAKSNRCNEDNVFGYVFIHEMMHAYYDAFENKGFPSREPLEEAFAEYGMLTFVNKNNASLPGDLLADACKHVESKIQPGPSEYGFGFDLFKITSGGDVDLINLYMRKSNKIDLEVIKNWKSENKYFEDIAHYPKSVDADKCFKGVKEILYYDWTEPCFIIQPSIRGSRGSKHGPFPVMPMLHRTKEWAVTACKIDWHFQYPLMKSDDLEQLMVQVLAVMKNEGFESYLSFSGDKIVFLGRLFSYYAATASEPNTLAESLNVKGNVVYPAFKARLTGGPAGQVGNILYALGTLLDGTFTLAHEGAEFVLYGPGSCVDLFSTNTKSSSLSVSPSAVVSSKVKYQIIDKATSRVLNNENSMAKTALFIVKDFCSNNPGITLVDLQKIFSSVPSHTAPGINIIESDGSVMAYKKTHPADKSMRFLENDPITLADGTVIMVSNQWAATGEKENFSAFKKVAEDLGYIIK